MRILIIHQYFLEDDDQEKMDNLKEKFFKYLTKFKDNPTKFFEDEIENFQYIANKMIKKISKVYGLAKDDEQVSESILNWDLHQQIMEKKYGKRKKHCSCLIWASYDADL